MTSRVTHWRGSEGMDPGGRGVAVGVHNNSHAAGPVAVVLGLLFGLAGTGTSAVSVALPALGADFGVGASGAAWVVSGYAVALAVMTAVHGRVADIVGIRLPLVVGVLMMAAGALLAAIAPAFPVLVTGRVLQGAGAAAVPVLGTALISARWEGGIRAGALGRVAGTAAALSSLGPVIGGALTAAGGWRLTILLPAVGLLTLPVIWRAAPAAGTAERFDVPGALFVAGAASGLVLVIQSASAGTGVAVVGTALLALGIPAVVARIRARPDGFLPRSIVTNTVVLRSAFAAAAVPAGWFALLIAVPTVLAAQGWSPLGIGLVLVPSAAAALTMPRITGVVLPRLGSAGSLALACPIAVLALLVAALGVVAAVPALLSTGVVLVTVAFGLGQPAMVSAVGEAVTENQRGVALGVATLIFFAGAGIGSAVVGGLAEPLGVAGALGVLVALPVAGSVVMMLRDRTTEPARHAVPALAVDRP